MSAADIAIVGAGVAGASLAAALAPHATVVLIEAEDTPGRQASGRSAAVFVPSYGDGPIRALSALSRPGFDAPDPAFWPAPLLRPRGLLRLCADGGREAYAAIHRGAVGVEALSLPEARALFPALAEGRFATASYEADVHDIDAEAYLRGCLRAAAAAGARLVTGAPVTTLARQGGAWRLCAGGQEVTAGVVVNAAGAWAGAVAALAGVGPLGLRALRRSVAVLPLPEVLQGGENGARGPFVVPFPLRWYAKEEAGRLLVSPGDADPVAPHDAWADDMVLAEGLDRFATDTGIAVTRLERSWAGLRTHAPDDRPVIGWARGAPGLFWLAGQGGFGIQTAPGVAALAAALILGTPAPLDPAPYAPARLSG